VRAVCYGAPTVPPEPVRLYRTHATTQRPHPQRTERAAHQPRRIPAEDRRVVLCGGAELLEHALLLFEHPRCHPRGKSKESEPNRRRDGPTTGRAEFNMSGQGAVSGDGSRPPSPLARLRAHSRSARRAQGRVDRVRRPKCRQAPRPWPGGVQPSLPGMATPPSASPDVAAESAATNAR
jgi:hypothetical protein